MPSILTRLLIAGICLVLLWIALPAFIDLLGLGINASLLILIRVCVAGIAIFYVIWGWPAKPIM